MLRHILTMKKIESIFITIVKYSIYLFLLVLIVMSIGRISNVLWYEFNNSIHPPDAKNEEQFTLINDSSGITLNKNTSSRYLYGFNNYSEYANYVGVAGYNLTAKLIAREINETLIVSGGVTANNNVLPEDIQNISKSVNIIKTSSSEVEKKYQYFGNISLDFIRSELGRILFLIILINIFSLVPFLIGDNSKGKREEEVENKKINLFVDLLLTTLVLGLLLTLLPQGNIGSIILSVDLNSGISAFLIIISFILVYLFKLEYVDKKIRRRLRKRIWHRW
jgi:hypothetical protein